MNRVTKRTWLMGLFLLILMGGMLLFMAEYVTEGKQWVAFPGSPHLYNGGNIGCGTITDRSGQVLVDITEERLYSGDANTRKSTLHWLGDRTGHINAAAISHYAAELSGFDLVNGIYDAGGTGGEATLTISAEVQNAAYKAMSGRKGTVAVYNYKTGEILCAVTTPTFDPDNVPDIAGDTTGAYEGVYLNRFIQSTYIPGSIYKVVTTAAALESAPQVLDMQFVCNGKIEYGTEAVTCGVWHGRQNLMQALANSCNCAYAQIAEEVGRKNMRKFVEQFGINNPVTFDGITTAKGSYDISAAAPVSFAWSCIGQYTDLVNPCSFMTFMGAIAGGGSGAEPYIVKQVQSGDKLTYKAKTTKTERIMSEDTAKKLQDFMRNNVQNVYGAWNFPGMSVCAKSGTSQLGGSEISNAMFAGFVTDEAYPLAFMVVVENGGYGAGACVPVLSKVLAACKTVMDAEAK